jgi:anthranilate synthase component 1
LTYDMVRFFEPTIPSPPRDELDLPDMFFLIAETVLIFDHRTRRLRIVSNAFIENDIDAAYANATAAIERLVNRLKASAKLPDIFVDRAGAPVAPAANTRPEEYLQMVRDGLEYIRAGDVFQFVPSQRFETDYGGDALTLLSHPALCQSVALHVLSQIRGSIRPRRQFSGSACACDERSRRNSSHRRDQTAGSDRRRR